MPSFPAPLFLTCLIVIAAQQSEQWPCAAHIGLGARSAFAFLQVLGLNRQIYAMKRVRMQNKDPEAIRGFIDEITLLRQLRSRSNIIQLMDAQVSVQALCDHMLHRFRTTALA